MFDSSKILDKQQLYELYFEKMQSVKVCAKVFNVGRRTIQNNFKFFGWKLRTRGEARRTPDMLAIAAEKFRQLGYRNKGKKHSDIVNKSKGRPGHFSSLKGKTKDTHPGVKRASDALKGRSKTNYNYLKLLSERMKENTQENIERRKKQGEAHYVHSTQECRDFIVNLILEHKNEYGKDFILWKTKQHFKWFNALRSYHQLVKEKHFVFKFIKSNSSVETKIENSILIPFFEEEFEKCSLLRQYSIKKMRLDIALFKNKTMFLICETKSFLSKNKVPKKYFLQLQKYLFETNTRFGLLSDGINFHWFENNASSVIEISMTKTIPLKIKSEYYNDIFTE